MNGVDIFGKRDIAEIFASEFCTMYTCIPTTEPNVIFDDNCVRRESIENVEVTESGIAEVINSLKPGKVNMEGIPLRIIKRASASIVKPLRIIYERSLLHAELPRHFKAARVTPVY